MCYQLLQALKHKFRKLVTYKYELTQPSLLDLTCPLQVTVISVHTGTKQQQAGAGR